MASSCGDSRDGNWSSGSPSAPSGGAAPVMGAGSEHVHHEQGPDDAARARREPTRPAPTRTEPDATGGNVKGGDAVDGGVTGTSVDVPSAPVQAPAATASGPAPDAVAPAPISPPRWSRPSCPSPRWAAQWAPTSRRQPTRADAGRRRHPAGRRRRPTGRRTVVRRACRCSARSVRWRRACPIRPRPHGRCSRRATGRSVAVLVALLAAIVLFLAVHRRVDRSDPKLSTRAHRA